MKLRPHCHTAIFSVPTFVSVGTVSAGATSVTPGLPAGATTNDILMVVIGKIGSISSGLTGYTLVTAANGAISDLIIYWKRHSGSESAPSVSVSPGTSGIIARMIAFRGCVATGNPFDQSASSIDNTNATALTFPAITSSRPNTLVINAVGEALSTSIGTAEFSGYTNSGLTGLTEAIDNTSTSGSGVGIGAAYGLLATITSSGATTVTAATAKNHQFITCNLLGTVT